MPAHQQRRPTSPEVYRRRQTVAALTVVTGVVLLAWGASKVFGGAGPAATTTTLAKATTTTSTTAPTTTTLVDPGTLPQTDQEPPTSNGSLSDQLAPLWGAIVSNNPAEGLPAFFPKSAYVSMKTGRLPDPAADYDGRLVAFYNLDVPAYHAAYAADPEAKLEAVNANPAYAHWVPAGECENNVGYWHLPGVRMVYRGSKGEQSFSVASLISWRGVWYVVHLGPNPRPSNAGTVDQPADGPGTPGPPGGC